VSSPITTHVLDTARGVPAATVPVTLEQYTDSEIWTALAHGNTDSDGRLRDLLSSDAVLVSGVYRLTFDTGAYFASLGETGAFYPSVQILFTVQDTEQHYHVPLLLSPFGYSTYRGS
jgi:5-hydroxyisourate hydrolase